MDLFRHSHYRIMTGTGTRSLWRHHNQFPLCPEKTLRSDLGGANEIYILWFRCALYLYVCTFPTLQRDCIYLDLTLRSFVHWLRSVPAGDINDDDQHMDCRIEADSEAAEAFRQ